MDYKRQLVSRYSRIVTAAASSAMDLVTDHLQEKAGISSQERDGLEIAGDVLSGLKQGAEALVETVADTAIDVAHQIGAISAEAREQIAWVKDSLSEKVDEVKQEVYEKAEQE